MADFTADPRSGFDYHDHARQGSALPQANQLVTWTNIAGAMVSLALIVGIGIWGYKLLVRDVSGIPVVRAVSGEMRVRPEDPGGSTASHQGLSVNAVAAEGATARPADRLILAPPPVDLEAEDQVMPAAMVASGPQAPVSVTPPSVAPIIPETEIAAALQSGDVDTLVAQLTAGVAPIAELEAEKVDEVVAAVTETVVAEVNAAERQVAKLIDAPGVRQSQRPRIRPAIRATVTPAALQLEDPAVREADPEALPAGTRLAQLGAFDSEDVARAQWDQLAARFEVYMRDKTRIVQKASSGGRTFYRLRVMGFEDIADARRFCSALVAENADCIPVVTR